MSFAGLAADQFPAECNVFGQEACGAFVDFVEDSDGGIGAFEDGR